MDERTKQLILNALNNEIERKFGQPHSNYGKVADVHRAIFKDDLLVIPGWQPIETAPKDVPILVCQIRNGIIRHAWGVDDHGNWKTGHGHMDYIVEVTHWMPLPPLPQAQGDSDMTTKEQDGEA